MPQSCMGRESNSQLLSQFSNFSCFFLFFNKRTFKNYTTSLKNLDYFHLFQLLYDMINIQGLHKSRYIKVKVEHYLLFMFSPLKNKLYCLRNKMHLFTVFYLIQPSSKKVFILISENKIMCYLQYSMYLDMNKSRKLKCSENLLRWR